MADRNMEGKAFKLQRQLRKLPRRMPETDDVEGIFILHNKPPLERTLKRFTEAVSAPRQPNSELLKGYKHRAASLSRDAAPEILTDNASRMEVIRHINRLRSLGVEEDKSFTILNTRVHRARVFYNPQRTVYVLLYENWRNQVVRSSFPHADKIELIDKFRGGFLQWVEFVSPHQSD